MLNPYQHKKQYATLRKHLWHLVELAEYLREFEHGDLDVAINGIAFERARRTENGAEIEYTVGGSHFILRLVVEKRLAETPLFAASEGD